MTKGDQVVDVPGVHFDPSEAVNYPPLAQEEIVGSALPVQKSEDVKENFPPWPSELHVIRSKHAML